MHPSRARIQPFAAADHRRLHASMVLLCAALLLGGCRAQSGIQSRYIDQQTDCRDYAESSLDAIPGAETLSAKRRNAALVDRFSSCMIKAGWHVARPVKNPVVPTPPGTADNPKEASLPAQPLPGQPSDVVTSGTRASAPSSPPNQPVKTEPSLLQPSPSQPALNEPASAVGGNAPPATYQPARGYTPPVESSPMPGRQF